jgi:hypothetical protein
MARETWIKHLTVDKRIVRLLSASTYENFPDAIREMVSNAYDADATEMHITIDLKQDFIEIRDNGNGMTPDEFGFFLRIAGQKRDKSRISPTYNRKQIGQFGVGFLAIFPFGGQIEVKSTATRSNIMFNAIIPAEKYVQGGQSIDVENIQIPGVEIVNDEYFNQHGTTIHIAGLTDMVHRFFSKDPNVKTRRDSISSWMPLDKLEWILQEELPLDYSPKSPYYEAFKDLGSSGIKIWLNNKELFRNSPGTDILENDIWEYKDIKCRYVIATNWKKVWPEEAHYFKQRLRNVGIGKRTPFSLGLVGRTFSRLNWMTGDIYIVDGFDSLLTIDRSRFVEGPEYDRFTEYFRQRLSHHIYRVEKISEAGKSIKKQLKETRSSKVGSRKEIVSEKIEQLKSKGFEVVTKSVKDVSKTTEPVKIDFHKKVVQLIEDHPEFTDSVTIGGKAILVRYTEWDNLLVPPIRRNENGILEINTKYSLFRSLRYGEVFKKILITAFVLSEKTNTADDLYRNLTKQLPKEFEDIIS